MKHGRIIDGKKEYGKRINCGIVPKANNSTSTPHGLSNVDFFTDCVGVASTEGGVWPEKIGIQNHSNVYVAIEGNNITLGAVSDNYNTANYIAIVELHYIKN